MTNEFPRNLVLLHQGEEALRLKGIALIEADRQLHLHADIVERTMDLLDIFRQFSNDDEDFKVVQMLSLRLFNAFASSMTLLLSGYSQNSALIMRDILETVFLFDYFQSHREAITSWRNADKKARLKHYRPIKIREALDRRDGFTSMKRAAIYDLFSELAGHPSMQSVAMLRPQGMDARNGPFLDPTVLQAVLSEMGRLAVQVGEAVGTFMPTDWEKGVASLKSFSIFKLKWIAEFYAETSGSVHT